MVHIHGLGLSTADETSYVATHYGLFRVRDGKSPQRVGDLAQDLMGFTILSANHFLASGHPDPADRQQPPHLGLIESTDAGESWESVSLQGSADFHALEYRHGRVYGHDSQTGKVMVSADGRSWQPKAEVGALDLAVSPIDGAEIFVTTSQGLLRSNDRALTFRPVVGAPALVLISWPDSGPIIGADAAGGLYSSTDRGQAWQLQHALGAKPNAVLAAEDGRVYVATDTAIYASTDNATTIRVHTEVE
jgi:photosystem II stability/assembly factor-like uncharacterized protein